MNVIDNILLEWSYRCPDGIVDLNNPEKVKILFEVLKPFLKEDLDDDILNVLTKIDDPETKEKVLKYLQNINKKEDKIEDKVENNLEKELKSKNFDEEKSEYISLLASKYNITKELESYLKSNQLLSLKDLDKSGNLYSIISTKTNFPEGFIRRIITYTPSEGNKALGIGEIALALFFDAKKLKAGDVLMNGKVIEIKGTESRFPGTGKGRSGDISHVYQEFEEKYPDISPKSLDVYISEIIKQNPNELSFINSTLDTMYPNTNSIKITSETTTPENIKNILFQKYITSYMETYKENDYYMLMSKGTSEYILYTPKELSDAVREGNVSFIGGVTKSSSYPQLKI